MSKQVVVAATLALIVGGGGGYWLASNEDRAPAVDVSASRSDEKKALFYRNPMNPAITSPVPAQDEMGMDYIPVYADGGSENNEPSGTVTIDPVVVQNIGVRTALAKQKSITRMINSLGRIDFNEEHLARLHPKITGWIEKLRVNETGTQVDKGSVLLSIYSPDLVAAQREYLVALNNWEKVRNKSTDCIQRSTKNLLKSTLERLQLFDVPAHQITELQETRKINRYLHIHSPFKGTVMNIGAREGQYVSPKKELYLIADLKRIWVYVDVYEDDLPWVKVNDKVEMHVRAAPGRLFEGKVRFIYPYLEGKTRTVRVRLEFDNEDRVLKPGMFANVLIKSDAQANAIVVPSEAIVRSGHREQVFVQGAPGKYEPRDVILGLSADGVTQIREGIKSGERVVTSAVFLIDSESKLREATAKMMEVISSGNDNDMEMGDMQMNDMDMNDLSMDNSKNEKKSVSKNKTMAH